MVICCEKSSKLLRGGSIRLSQLDPRGGSEEAESRAGDSWGGELWAESTAYARVQGRKEGGIFLEQKEGQ